MQTEQTNPCYSADAHGQKPLKVMTLPKYLDWITEDMKNIESQPSNVWHIPGVFVKTSPCMDPTSHRILYTTNAEEADHEKDMSDYELAISNIDLRTAQQNASRRKLLTGKKPIVSQENLQQLHQMYKIHLMLTSNQLKNGLLQTLIEQSVLDIMAVKYRNPSEKDIDPEFADETGNAIVVIYCRPGVVSSKRVFANTLALFGDLPLEIVRVPRYNIHVKGPMFYAGGDGDAKEHFLEKGAHPEAHMLFDASVNHALYVGQPRLDI